MKISRPKLLSVRVTEEEWRQLRLAAVHSGNTSVSDYVRATLCQAPVLAVEPVKVGRRAVAR